MSDFKKAAFFFSWLGAYRRAIPASCKGDPLSVQQKGKAREVIFTTAPTAKQGAEGES